MRKRSWPASYEEKYNMLAEEKIKMLPLLKERRRVLEAQIKAMKKDLKIVKREIAFIDEITEGKNA